MSETENLLTAKVWNLAHVMNNAGVGSGDYVEQVTYLLFLKLDAEREEDGLPSLLPPQYRWARLAALTGRADGPRTRAALCPDAASTRRATRPCRHHLHPRPPQH